MEPATADDPRERLFSLLPPIFRDCCDPEARRYDFSTPFVVGDFVYATDGRIIVRRLATPKVIEAFGVVRDAVPGARRIGKPGKVYSPWTFSEHPVTLPQTVELPDCRKCKGEGWRETCEKCNGKGFVTCDYGHNHTCQNCNGACKTERSTCRHCEGTGSEGGYSSGVPLNDKVWIAYHVLNILHKHGATVYAPDPADSKHNPFRFTAGDDTEGRFMPMTIENCGI